MRTGQVLLDMLLLACAAHGLGAERLEPWQGWILFKQYAREVSETPDPGVSVQLTEDKKEQTVSLVFLRQMVEEVEDRLKPTGGVVCDFTFPLEGRHVPDWEAWSFDFPTFERFIDVVEGHGAFQDLVVARPISRTIYWLEA
ncbi:MAG: hypothetical protein ACRENK_08845 [Gemmatimonadaceae bacterium]